MKHREYIGWLERSRLVETSALTLVISRRSRRQMTSIFRWSKRQLWLLVVVERGPFVWLSRSPVQEQFFRIAPRENSPNARDRMLGGKEIRMPGSKEANFFSRLCRIPCVGFLPSVGNVGWFTTAYMKIAEQWLSYCCVSFRISKQILQHYSSHRCRSVLSHFSSLRSRV